MCEILDVLAHGYDYTDDLVAWDELDESSGEFTLNSIVCRYSEGIYRERGDELSFMDVVVGPTDAYIKRSGVA